MKTLDEIGLDHRTDKASHHHGFLRFYERRLREMRSDSFVLVEFGVFNGGSIKTWAEYFPNATIVGCDIEEKQIAALRGGVHLRQGDSTDVVFLSSLISEFNSPTVIIDDASHRWDHQIITLHLMFPFLKPGGIYILEDIDTSFGNYGATFKGYANITAFEYIAHLSRFVASGGAFGPGEVPFDHFIAVYGQQIEGIEISSRTVLITKKPNR